MAALFEMMPMKIDRGVANAEYGGHGVGVEVELEGWGGDGVVGSKWHLVNDGSLRGGGIENVMVGPLYGEDITIAFEQLDRWFNNKTNKLSFKVNDRCSIHVHIDVRDLSPEAMRRLLTVYMIFEKSIYKYCGDGRASSNYCPPVAECQDALPVIGEFMRKKRDRSTLEEMIHHFGKYCGLNFNALRRFGSLEFRMHEGSLDAKDIAHWTKMLINMKTFAASNRALKACDIPSLASKVGFEELCATVFGDTFESIYLQDNFRQDCYDGVRTLEYCQNLDAFKDNAAKVMGEPAKKFDRFDYARVNVDFDGVEAQGHVPMPIHDGRDVGVQRAPAAPAPAVEAPEGAVQHEDWMIEARRLRAEQREVHEQALRQIRVNARAARRNEERG